MTAPNPSAQKPATAKRKSRRIRRRPWTTAEQKKLEAHSNARTPVKVIARELRRTPGALRQRALELNISLGHQRRWSPAEYKMAALQATRTVMSATFSAENSPTVCPANRRL